MLDGFQLRTAAHETEYGELLCDDCAEDSFTRPVIQYNLDQLQSEYAQDYVYDSDEEHVQDCGCEPGLYCDSCGTELAEEYTDPDCDNLRNGDDDA